ncbi:hypothetical protein BC828DRAFT_297638 [Blastocladiella britannica]|nr:hypothetical protein BC828DRAFT_297638 [Blastocladiella britannica]
MVRPRVRISQRSLSKYKVGSDVQTGSGFQNGCLLRPHSPGLKYGECRDAKGQTFMIRDMDRRIREVLNATHGPEHNAHHALIGERISGRNLSRILHCEAIQLETAYTNNVKTQFTKYVTRCIRGDVTRALSAAIADRLVHIQRAIIKRYSGAWIRYVLGGGAIPWLNPSVSC